MKYLPFRFRKFFGENLFGKDLIKENKGPELMLNPLPLVDQLNKYAPLLDLQDKRQLLKVSVESSQHNQDYQSMVLAVDFVNQTVVLDAFASINPYCPIQIGDRLHISHQHQGQILAFSGVVKRVIKTHDNDAYELDLPKDLAYKQRRFYPRIELTSEDRTQHSFYLHLKSPRKTSWQNRLQNISAGGMRVSVPGNILPQLSVGLCLPKAVLQLGDLKISTQLKVKSYRHHRRPYEHTDISFCFCDIHYQDRLRLQNHISFFKDLAKESQLMATS